MPFLLLPIAGLLGYSWGTKSEANDALATAQENSGGLNANKIILYAIIGGIGFYAVKKLVK